MGQIIVGVRELKEGLSRYLRQVAEGNTVLITDRGRPVGQIVPYRNDLEDRVQQLVASGFLNWNGQKFAPRKPRVKNNGSRTVADLLIEDRE